jgi:hypothetical protein
MSFPANPTSLPSRCGSPRSVPHRQTDSSKDLKIFAGFGAVGWVLVVPWVSWFDAGLVRRTYALVEIESSDGKEEEEEYTAEISRR